jgi:hypothetical protein
MSETRAFMLVALGGVVAMAAARFGLGALGASHEQIAAAWGVCLAGTGLVGGFVASHFASPDDHR